MNAGYFIEQDLMYRTDAYSATVQPSDEKSTLQKEEEDNEDIDCLIKTLLKQAILTCLKMAVGACAKHECHGCKMNHPSQKYHDICLCTSSREWIEDYGCHDPALEGLNIYDVMKDFDNRIWNYLYGDNWRHPMDNRIWNYLYGDNWRHPMDFTTGINHLTPEENQEAYKNWQYFKKNQSDLTEPWKTYWAKKLIESYEEKETEENENTETK